MITSSFAGPRPRVVTYDTGSEFTSFEFQELLQSNGIETNPTIIKHAQSNSFVAMVHLTIGGHLRGIEFASEEPWKQQICATL